MRNLPSVTVRFCIVIVDGEEPFKVPLEPFCSKISVLLLCIINVLSHSVACPLCNMECCFTEVLLLDFQLWTTVIEIRGPLLL